MSTAMAFDIAWPEKDVRSLFAQIERAQKQLKMDERKALQMAGYFVARSLSASTKVSAKTRPIVKNPHKDAGTDKRRAPYGVMKWKNGKQVFQPIYKTGEFGGLRFFDKKTVAWHDRSGGSGQWKKIASGADPANPEIIVPGIKSDKRRKIGRRGFAKKSWQWASKHIRNSGSGRIMDIPDMVEIDWSKSKGETVLKITNNVRYIEAAMKGGREAVDTAMNRAANGLRDSIDRQLKKRLGAK